MFFLCWITTKRAINLNVWQAAQLHIQYWQIKNIFFSLKKKSISDSINLIERFGKVNINLPRWTKFTIDNALFSSQSKKNLCCNDYHIETDRKMRQNIFILYLLDCMFFKFIVCNYILVFNKVVIEELKVKIVYPWIQ